MSQENTTVFAKTLIVDGTQVLIFWEYDPDSEDYELQFKTNINGIGATLGFRFDDKDDVINCFDKLDEAQCKKLLDGLKQQLGED